MTGFFFRRVASGEPLAPEESIVYWYYLPAMVYASLLVVAFVLWKRRLVSAKNFAYLIVFLAAFGVYNTTKLMKFTSIGLLLLTFPVLFLIYVLFARRKA